MASRILAAADSLADFAERGRSTGRDRRELAITPPYLIRYRVRGDLVQIEDLVEKPRWVLAPISLPLLVENGLQHQADRVLVVDVDEATQLRRTIQRDGIDRQQAQNILSAQATRSARLAVADDVINNSGAPADALPQVAALHQRYLTLAATQQD